MWGCGRSLCLRHRDPATLSGARRSLNADTRARDPPPLGCDIAVFNSEEEAKQAYLSNYEAGWEQGRRLDITGVSKDEFNAWLEESKRKRKPFAEYAGVKAQSEQKRFDRTAPATPEAQRSAIGRIVDFAKRVKDRVERAVIGGITKRQIQDLAEQGIEIDDTWVHSFESSAVSHNQKHHGNAKAEESRGQIAVTEDDYNRIPEILETYDKVSKSPNTTNRTDNEVIIYEKEYDDGYVYYLEEKRDNRKSLAFQTMYKKKKGTDSSDGLMHDASTSTPLATPDNLSSNSAGKDNTFFANNQISEDQSALKGDNSAEKQAGDEETPLTAEDMDDTIDVNDNARRARQSVNEARKASHKAVRKLSDKIWEKGSKEEIDLLEKENAEAMRAYHQKLDEYAEELLKSTDQEIEKFAEAVADKKEYYALMRDAGDFNLKEETRKKFEAFATRLKEAVERQRSAKAYAEATDISSFEGKKPKKFNILEASADKSPNEAYVGVSHIAEDKVAVATNGSVLVVTGKDYDPTQAGKRVGDKGVELGEASQLPYKRIINRKEQPITFKSLRAAQIAQMSAALKSIPAKERRQATVVVAFGRGVYVTFNAADWDVFLRAAAHVGAVDITVYPGRVVTATAREGAAAIIGIEPGEKATLRHDMTAGVKLHAEAADNGATPAHREVYEAMKGLVEDAGIEVIEVGDAEAQAMLGNKKTPVAGQPNRVNEKLTSGSILMSVQGDSSSRIRIPSQVLAKIAKATQSTNNNLRKYASGDFVVDTSSVEAAIRGLSKLLNLQTKGASRYNILLTDKGESIAVRLSDHAANGNNFRRDGADKNLSLVIERRKFDTPYSAIEFTEVTIPESTFIANSRDVIESIVNGVSNVLRDREFTLDERLGTVEKKGSREEFTNFFTNRKPHKKDSVGGHSQGRTHVTSDEAGQPVSGSIRPHDNAQKSATDAKVDNTKVDKKTEADKAGGEKPATDARFYCDTHGTVYGWTVGGKIYLNRDAMNPKTPLHEYTHLWDEMVKKENPELWRRGVELMKQTPVWREVMEDSNYADIHGDEDAVASEVHSRLTGRDGARLMEEMIERGKREGVFKEAEARGFVAQLKIWLKDMFKSLKRTLSKWSKRELDELTIEDFNRMTMRDLAEGINPRQEIRRGDNTRIVTEANPMLDDYHRGVRSREDVMLFDEVLAEAEKSWKEYGDLTYPDMDIDMLREAKSTGKITIYSSKPIEAGVFVTPSRMNAEDYAGGGRVYSKEVKVDEVAWTGEDEGQYAPTGYSDEGNVRLRSVVVPAASRPGPLSGARRSLNADSRARDLPPLGRDVAVLYAMSRDKVDFERTRDRAVEQRGIVVDGLADKNVKIVSVGCHDFEGEKPIAQARLWAKEHIVGEHELTDSEGRRVKYNISGRTIEKYLSETAIGKSDNMAAHLSVLKQLPEVIGESIEAEIHADYKKGDDGKRTADNGYGDDILIHRFYGAAEIDGKMYRVKTTILENGRTQKNKPHSFEVSNVELIEESTGRTIMDASIVPASPEGSIPIAKLLKGVEKSYDKGVKLLDVSRKNVRDNVINGLQRKLKSANDKHAHLEQELAEAEDALRRIQDEEAGMMDIVEAFYGSKEEAIADMTATIARRREVVEASRRVVSEYEKAIMERRAVITEALEREGIEIDKPIGIEKAKELFDRYNDDAENGELMERACELLGKVDAEIAFTDKLPDDVGARYHRAGRVELRVEMLYGSEHSKYARYILHEMLHGVTLYALETSPERLPEGLRKGAKMMKEVFDAISRDEEFKDEYGRRTVLEMAAELSNPLFRAKLKAKELWGRFVEALRELLGLNKGTAYEGARGALEKMLDEFDVDIWEGYRREIRREMGEAVDVREKSLEEKTDEATRRKIVDSNKYRTSVEIDEQYPNWLEGTTTESGKHTTQVEGTRKTYNKVGDWIEANLGKEVEILDASSGMGYGTVDLRRRGFNIEDVEPYQSEQRKAENPATYDSYDKVDKQYDVIISNAVLNVIPDDWRANVLHDMASRLKTGGKLFINTRKAGEERAIKDKIELDSPQEVLVKRNGRIASYQRFFTPKELQKWVSEELDDGYEVEIANEGNSGTKGLAAVVVTRGDSRELTEKAMTRRVEELSEKFGLPIEIVRTEAERDALEKRRERRAKGWWDETTDKVVVVIPNHKDIADVENTVTHEVIGHKGLRAFIGKERFAEFIRSIYNHLEDNLRAIVDAMAERQASRFEENYFERLRLQRVANSQDKSHKDYGKDWRWFEQIDRAEASAEAYKRREKFRDDAMEEYMSDLGGRISDQGFEKMSREELTLWGKIKAKVQQFLDAFLKKMNISARIRLSDKDLAYILFKSWKHAREQAGTADPTMKIFDKAEDISMRHRTGYGKDPLMEQSKRERAEARRQRRKAEIERIAAEEDEYIKDPAEKVVISGRDDMKSLMRRLGCTEAEAEEEAQEYEKMLASDRVLSGCYDPVTKKIIIFAETLSGPTATRITMQHEELHHQIAVNPRLREAQRQLVPKLKEIRSDLWQMVEQKYAGKDIAEREEELVVYTIERGIGADNLDDIYNSLSLAEQTNFIQLLKSIGYEKEEHIRQNVHHIQRRPRSLYGSSREGRTENEGGTPTPGYRGELERETGEPEGGPLARRGLADDSDNRYRTADEGVAYHNARMMQPWVDKLGTLRDKRRQWGYLSEGEKAELRALAEQERQWEADYAATHTDTPVKTGRRSRFDVFGEQYARSSRYQRELNEISRAAGPLHDEEGRFNPIEARWQGEQSIKVLGRWREELLEERSRCSRAGQAEIDAELAQLDYRQEYYRRLSQGEDVDNSRFNRRNYLEEIVDREDGSLRAADIDDFDYDLDTHYRDGDFSLEEFITKMKTDAAQANADDLNAKHEAMRAIGGNLNKLRRAMSQQRKYDIATVKSITDLARIMLDGNLIEDMSKTDTKRVLSTVVKSVGRQDVSPQVEKLMDIMVDNQLRQGARTFGSLLTIKGSKVDARGIEVQGKLDPEGQQIAKVVKKTKDLPVDELRQKIDDATNRMGNPVKAIAEEAATELTGLEIALRYAEDIGASKRQEADLRNEMRLARAEREAGQISAEDYREFVKTTEDAIREMKIDRAEAYQSLVDQMTGTLSESVIRAKEWREAEKQRVNNIHHLANSDMQGRPSDEHHKETKLQKISNNAVLRFVCAPLATFEQMLRMFGNKNVRGEGYLWNHFVRGWEEATEKEYIGYRDAIQELDNKVSEVFGKKKMTWGDLFAVDRNLPTAKVWFMDGGEMKEHILTQGNLLYIYMVNKMADGRMKLRKMGITESDVEEIAKGLDPRFIELADWLQEEYLVEKRNKYNEVHKRMFGASMAAIDNYFPLKILANARVEEVDVASDTSEVGLPGISTGSIIKRRRNALALDVTGANAFSVILNHLQEMERWAAFAEFNRDLNTLLSYRRFHNQVLNMNSAYGAGKTLWNNFRNVCSMAAGTYRPPIAALDKAAVNVAKGVTAAKVSFRVFTAMKQLLSMPAYISDCNPVHLAANLANPVKAWMWSMENLPLFEKRWRSRMAGDPRLLKTDMDWKAWRSRVVELASRIGMSPNAFVDALTVAIGARSMYQTKLAKYTRMGYPEDIAEQRAKQDASILFNQTQQSSEGAFLSTMQVDRSWLSVMFTVFRNASMSYTRQTYDAIRNIGRRLQPGYKGMTEEFMAKQMARDGIDPDRASKNAKREYRRSLIRDFVRVGIFGYVLELAWNLGANGLYLLFGDDEDEKKKMLKDASNHAFFGSIEGLTGGDVMSMGGHMAVNGEANWSYLEKDMPISADLARIAKKLGKDNISAMNDVINLIVQSGVGVNPESLTNAVVAVMDYCKEPDTQRECALLIARIANCPPSDLDKIYFDELGVDGMAASKMTPSEIAERYADYKMLQEAPLTGKLRSREDADSIRGKKVDKVMKDIKSRVNTGLQSEDLKRLLAEYEEAKSEIKLLKDKKSAATERGDKWEARAIGKEIKWHPKKAFVDRVNMYKRDMKELTGQFLNSKTPEERDSLAKAMVGCRDRLLEEIAEY